MTNVEVVNILDEDGHSSYINKMFWIAGSIHSTELIYFLEGFEESEWKEIFPDIDYPEDGEIMLEILDADKLGFIVEVNHPEYSNFDYNDEGEVISCSLAMGICRISYHYGESLEEIVEKIKIKSEEIYQEYIEEDKNKTSHL